MRLKMPTRASILLDQFNKTIQVTGSEPVGEPPDPPKDKNGHLPTRILQSVLDMRTSLVDGINIKIGLVGDLRLAQEAFVEADQRLRRTVRDAWEMTRRRVSGGGLPKSIYATFGLTADGRNPKEVAAARWPVFAETLIKAEAELVEKGFEPTASPNLDTLREKLDQYMVKRKAKLQAKNVLTNYNQGFHELQLEASRLFQLVMSELRRELRDFDPSERREIMRTYGAEFYSPDTAENQEPPVDGGETPETEEPPVTEGETPDGSGEQPGSVDPTPDLREPAA